MGDDLVMDRQRTLFELEEAWRLAGTKGTDLSRLLLALGYVLLRCPDDMIDHVYAAIVNVEGRLLHAALAEKEKVSIEREPDMPVHVPEERGPEEWT